MNHREKINVLPQSTTSHPKATSRFSIPVVILAVLGLGSYFSGTRDAAVTQWSHGGGRSCPQADALVPQASGALWNTLGAVYASDDFRTRAVDWLGGAVRIQ